MVISDTGMIHKARASFTVVATFRASSPYLPAAPLQNWCHEFPQHTTTQTVPVKDSAGAR